MNIATATARPLAAGSLVSKATPFIVPLPEKRIVILLLSILFSALALLYIKDLNRRLFIHQQQLQQVEHRLEIEHNTLILERSTLTTPTRVRQIAIKDLHMTALAPKQAVIIDV